MTPIRHFTSSCGCSGLLHDMLSQHHKTSLGQPEVVLGFCANPGEVSKITFKTTLKGENHMLQISRPNAKRGGRLAAPRHSSLDTTADVLHLIGVTFYLPARLGNMRKMHTNISLSIAALLLLPNCRRGSRTYCPQRENRSRPNMNP